MISVILKSGMARLLIASALVGMLLACEKSSPPLPTVVNPEPGKVGLSATSADLELSSTVKVRRFDLRGRGCKSIRAKLVHLSEGKIHTMTDYSFEKLPESVEGSLWLMAQDGEPFGIKGKTSYSLGQSMKSGSMTCSSSGFALFQGPYSITSEHAETQSSYFSGEEYVILARWMVKDHSEGSRSLSSGNLEFLRKQTDGNQAEILAATLQWER